MKRLSLLFLMFPLCLAAQNKLSIHIHGVKTSDGQINVAVYDKEEHFLRFDKVYRADSTRARQGVTSIDIEDLPPGEYALAIFHDENGNKQLDKNWLGIPKEAVGFSRTGMKRFGPPSYHECVLHIRTDEQIDISL